MKDVITSAAVEYSVSIIEANEVLPVGKGYLVIVRFLLAEMNRALGIEHGNRPVVVFKAVPVVLNDHAFHQLWIPRHGNVNGLPKSISVYRILHLDHVPDCNRVLFGKIIIPRNSA